MTHTTPRQETIIENAAERLLEQMLEGCVPVIEAAAKASWEIQRDTGWSDATPFQQRLMVIATIEHVATRLSSFAYETGVAEGRP